MFIKSEVVKKLKSTGLRWRFVSEYLKIDHRRKMFYEKQKKTRVDLIGLNLYKKIDLILKKRKEKFIIDEERYRSDNTYKLTSKNYLLGLDIKNRLAAIYLFAKNETFEKIWGIEKENNENTELKLTADEIFWLIKNYNDDFFGKLEFYPEIIDYREEIKFLYKKGVKKHNLGQLYQLHEFGEIRADSGTVLHLETYLKKLPKVNNNKKSRFNEEIKKSLIEFVEANKVPATIENATNMVKYMNYNINQNEAVKVLISVNIKHPEFLKEPIEIVENEFGRFDFDKRNYFAIFRDNI